MKLFASSSSRGIAAFIVACAATTAAQSSTLYGTEYSATTPLYTLDQSSGALAAGPSTGVSGIGDLASDPTSTSVWGVQILENTLYKFDAATGATLSSIGIDSSDPIVSIAWDPVGQTLYGVSTKSFGGDNTLWKIDDATGAATLVGNTQLDALYGLAFDANGKLYGTTGEAGETSHLWTIDTATAAAANVGDLGVTGNFDIAFRPEDNQLFMASSGRYALFTVDAATATASFVGPYGSDTNIAGLAFVGAVPEPETYALMAAGLGLIGWLTRRRRQQVH